MNSLGVHAHQSFCKLKFMIYYFNNCWSMGYLNNIFQSINWWVTLEPKIGTLLVQYFTNYIQVTAYLFMCYTCAVMFFLSVSLHSRSISKKWQKILSVFSWTSLKNCENISVCHLSQEKSNILSYEYLKQSVLRWGQRRFLVLNRVGH